MIPYKNKKLTSWPDVADIHSEGRNTSAGGKDYLRNRKKKAAIRRNLKRADKQISMKEIRNGNI
jgi:hypothetical protein